MMRGIPHKMVKSAQLRYRWEWVDLLLALLLAVLLTLPLALFTAGLFCFWAMLGLLMALIFTSIMTHRLKKQKSMNEKDQPALYPRVRKAADELSMKLPPVYIDPSGEVNAYAHGLISPVIIVNRGLLDLMNEDETLFVIGHEMGHIKLKHSALKTLLEKGLSRIPIFLYLPIMVYKFLFLRGRLNRSMEFSADRAGLHACGDIRAAIRTMIKLKTSRKNVDPSDIEEALRMDLSDIAGIKRENIITATFSTHPGGLRRIEELVRYSRRTGVGWTRK